MVKMLRALGRAFLNIIYPLNCRICHAKLAENSGLCASCASKIRKNEFGVAACQYEGVFKEALHLFKYRGVTSLLNTFSRIFLEFIGRNIDMKKIDMIVPIPLDPSKLRERGFNQAHLLSMPVSKKYNIPVAASNLVKRRRTLPQSSLNRRERLNNLKGVFSVRNGRLLKGKRVLLVDDVYTTGTTIKRACDALKKAGVSKIKIATLARGV